MKNERSVVDERKVIEIESLPVVKNELLRKEHVEYCMAWHRDIGDRNKVIYNDMGGDAATVLLFSNAREIISTGGNPFNVYSQEYLTKYWSFIDKKPIPHAGAIGYSSGSFTAENFEPSKSYWEFFREDMSDRKRRGYWNRNRTSHLLGEDRVLLIELKKLGVEKNTISIKNHKNFSTDITFEWAYPGENSKPRKITYLSKTLMNAIDDGERIIMNSDCYYQKGSASNETYSLLEGVPYQLRIDTKAIVAIGYQFKINVNRLSNEAYKEGLRGALAGRFSPLVPDPRYDALIDNLPESDHDYENNKYGMKMHVFERDPMPIRKYKTSKS